MIESVHHNFIGSNWLQTLSNELINSPGWIFRQKFWRYYLVQGLATYHENDASTWYHNQQQALNTMSLPWAKLFDKVSELAGPEFRLMRYALTGQTQNQHPVLHTDVSETLAGHYTSYLIYLNTHWETQLQGSTDFFKHNVLTHQEYPEPGKLVVFDSKVFHQGNPPHKEDTLRLTLVLHGQHV